MRTTSELRGEIIEKGANLETLVGAILSLKYFGRVKKSFVFDLLGDEYCSFALKRRVLLKLLPELKEIKSFEENLNRLNTIRNYFAHVGTVFSEGPEPGANSRMPDPRDFEKSVDFHKLYEEFVEKEKHVLEVLFVHFQKLGGQLS